MAANIQYLRLLRRISYGRAGQHANWVFMKFNVRECNGSVKNLTNAISIADVLSRSAN